MKRRENNYFTVKAGLEGSQKASLCLELPIRLQSDMSRYFESSEGVEKLNEFFFSYTALSEEQQAIFQFSIYEAESYLLSVADLFCMLRAFRHTFCK